MDGFTLIDNLSGGMEGVNVNTGQLIWSYVPSGYAGNFVVDDGLVVTGAIADFNTPSENIGLEAHNESDGSLAWKQFPSPACGGTYENFMASGGTLYSQNMCTGDLEVRDVRTGVQQSAITGYTWSSPTVGDAIYGLATDGPSLYLATVRESSSDGGATLTHASSVRAYSGGSQTWRTQLPGDLFVLVQPVVAGAVVYVTGADETAGTVTTFALNASTGQILWTSQAIAGDSHDAPFVADGHLVVGSNVWGIN